MTSYIIIGSGQMGSEHILSLRAIEEASIVGIVEPNEKSQELAKAMLGPNNRPQFFNSLDEFFQSELYKNQQCDAAVIATPNFTHDEILLKLVGKPINILIEKPLAITTQKCRAILQECTKHPGIIWVGLEYSFIPAISKALEMVNKGAVGTVKMIYIREHRYPFLPKVNNWNRFNKYSGGTLIEKCCHFFDLMTVIANSKPLWVFADGSQAVNHLDESYNNQRPDILDNAYAIVNFENSVRGCLDLCMFAEASEDEQLITVVGDEGKIEVKIPSQVLTYGQRKSGRHVVKKIEVKNNDIKYHGFHWGSTYLEHLAFLEAIKTKKAPKVGLERGLLSVAIGEAGQISIEKNRPIYLKDINGYN